MDLYFAGAEQPVYLRQLDELGVSTIAISFYEWQKRHPIDDLYRHVPAHMKVIITPGVAKKETMDWDAYCTDYLDFVERNADHALIYDLDAPHCPADIRQHVRNRLDLLPNTVMFPMEGEAISAMADEFERIGINSRTAKSMINNELRRLQASLYGSNITDAKTLRTGRFTATTSFVWLSGRRYGELWVFARNKMNHYPADRLAAAVRSHRDDIEALGVDPTKCAANDPAALTEVAVRSCQVMAMSLSKRPRDRKTVQVPAASPEASGGESSGSDPHNPAALELGNGARPINERERVLLPVVSMNDQVNGGQVRSVSTSMRACNSCHLSDECPKFEVDAVCAFHLPVVIKSDEQWEAAVQTILEKQYGRVMFATMAEDMEGGTLQPRVGQEMDRFMKLLATTKELKTPVVPPGAGIMAEIFGPPPDENDAPEGGEDDDEETDEDTVYEGQIEEG